MFLWCVSVTLMHYILNTSMQEGECAHVHVPAPIFSSHQSWVLQMEGKPEKERAGYKMAGTLADISLTCL